MEEPTATPAAVVAIWANMPGWRGAATAVGGGAAETGAEGGALCGKLDGLLTPLSNLNWFFEWEIYFIDEINSIVATERLFYKNIIEILKNLNQ